VRSYFDGAERLRVSQRTYFFTDPSSTPRARTTFQEYFYDALGRRVALRSQRDSTCTDAGDPTPGWDCAQTMERFVWDGDQLLVELRDYGKWGDAAATLNTGGSGASGAFYGSVGYTYALGLFGPDAPLTVQSGNLGGGGFVPQASWRGTYEDGTAADGADFGGTTYNWPGQQTGLYLAPDARIATITATRWLGSLVEGKADASGLVYDRNRYYDPGAGRFTQEDPAGLAGGVNLYGYAGADPANNTDPFGLSPDSSGQGSDSQGQGADSKKGNSDPCTAYGSSKTMSTICKRVSGPDASPENKCAARCLADQWSDEEKAKGRPLNAWEEFKYVVFDHLMCYHKCGYGPLKFAYDFWRASGEKGRPQSPPKFNAWLCNRAAICGQP
jgi:RHS repeat-associated protein